MERIGSDKPTVAYVIENLRNSVLFELASDAVLKEVAKVVRVSSIKVGERLIEKGAHGDSMYIVCRGRVKVHDGDLVLSYLGPGHTFGEMAALDGEVRTASITAVEDTELVQLFRDDLLALIAKEPGVAKALIHFLCQRGKNIINDVTERSFKLRALEREIEIGRDIQAGFLPDHLPKIPGWEIAARFEAAREVSGDFYDVFPLGLNTVGLVVGDVCGKGIGAALFMTLFRSLIRASLLAGDFINYADKEDKRRESVDMLDDRSLLRNSISLTNNYINHTHGDSCMFATVFVAALNTETGDLLYINAGHESPVILRKDGEMCLLKPTGISVGFLVDTGYEVGEAKLNSGDFLVAFTDGVTEAVDSDNEQFGSERLFKLLQEYPGSIQEKLDEVVRRLRELCGEAEQFDDITLLGVGKCDNFSRIL